MKTRYFIVCALCLLLAFVPISNAAKKKPISIEVLTTYDYPGVGNSTTPFGINGDGVVVGDFMDSAGVRRGFIRYPDGTFSPPIVPPDTGNFTRSQGINNAQTIVGDFLDTTTSTFRGYILSGGVFTTFDFPGPYSTTISGINDAGNFVGIFGNFAEPNQGFMNIGGVSSQINIPGATTSEATGINNANQIVGTYTDGTGTHGFFRDADGSLTLPLDYPGATTTRAFGVNDHGWIVGRWDGADRAHGFFLLLPNTYIGFDFPGATNTSLNGISQAGFISGRYTDTAGIRHGFIARVKYVKPQ